MNTEYVIVIINNETQELKGYIKYDFSIDDYLLTDSVTDAIVYKNLYIAQQKLEDIKRESIFENNQTHLEIRGVMPVQPEMLWIDKIKYHLNKIKEITDIFKNPFMNDAGGSNDCRRIYDKVNKELELLNIYG